jgi:hypothetical protein
MVAAEETTLAADGRYLWWQRPTASFTADNRFIYSGCPLIQKYVYIYILLHFIAIV